MKKEDTEYTYILRASNDLGQQEYGVKISTSEEPESKFYIILVVTLELYLIDVYNNTSAFHFKF